MGDILSHQRQAVNFRGRCDEGVARLNGAAMGFAASDEAPAFAGDCQLDGQDAAFKAN
jgi:hypothetical protein